MLEDVPQPQPETQTTTLNEGAGVADGTVLPTPAGLPDERVVYDYDADGNLIGWHKEPVVGV
jgi:hypothetical protein